MAAHRIARFTAIMHGRSTRLDISADSLVVRIVNGPDSGVVWRSPGPAAERVTLKGPAYPLVFTPIGLPRGLGNGTYTFSRGTARRSVVARARPPETGARVNNGRTEERRHLRRPGSEARMRRSEPVWGSETVGSEAEAASTAP